MQLMDVLRNRRAVRDFTDAPLSRTTIEGLIDAAIQAPSAMNLQPWAFGVLLDRKRIDEYAAQSKKWVLESAELTGHGVEARKMLEHPEFTMFYHAPALVLVMAEGPATQAAEDCCLAAQNLMLAARDEGIGSCWIGFARPWRNLPSTKQTLGLPANCEVVAPNVLGLPRAWPESHSRKPASIQWVQA